jgi:hypothetical protein
MWVRQPASQATTWVAPLASRFPDGLDRFAEDQEFADKAAEPAFTIVPGYAFPSIENGAVATMIAGILGTLLLFGLAFGLAKLLRSKHEA